ncbi:MAG: biotin--[acetyl-CoA-carboxylase] ligase [Firmicutes bacterium]|nr:biotin--[acetyl-CoA-carboxylase] ligase [[Eubacterium] siraeum]MCM1488640.1 biotin--[acetyl-CoA-carboxylase] ligase [Bacillota bacterium]
MKVVEELLKIMDSSGGENISGQELAEKLGVSRTAVWKAMNKLQEQGYEIEATRNRGYRMIRSGDLLSAEQISGYLSPEVKTADIQVFKSISSTNTYAKKLAADGAKSGTVIIADQQTEGRGRRGNSFFSPPKTGLYMSVILRPKGFEAETDMVTVCAGCAVCRAIEKLTDKKPLIKWVNDIYLKEKKICGILTEGVVDFETGHIDNIVVGIGLNITTGDFPEDIEQKAGALDHKISRNRIAAEIIEELYHCLNRTREENIKDYKNRSLVLGKEVYYLKNGVPHHGEALDIDQKGQLIVLTQNGRETLNSGEISVRF